MVCMHDCIARLFEDNCMLFTWFCSQQLWYAASALQGDVEARLSAAAEQLLGAFEALLARLVQPLPSTTAVNTTTSAAAAAQPGCSSPTAALPAASCPSPLTKSIASYLSGSGSPAASAAARPVSRQLFSSSSFGSSSSSNGSSTSTSRPGSPAADVQLPASLASLLVEFDDSWLEYLDQFVVWKGHDARGLEAELMRMAVRLERSMRLKLGRREPDSPEVMANPDLKVRRLLMMLLMLMLLLMVN
jgi:hypothetical protein